MNKYYVKFAYENNRLCYKESSSEEMGNLGSFLASDVGCLMVVFRDLVFDNTITAADGNVTSLEKEGDFIILGDLYSENKDGGPYLKIHKDEFIKILDAWEQFCKTKPREIIITKEGETFTIEAKD